MSYRDELWAQPVAGQITQACVPAKGRIRNFLPQTLGLEVIRYEAYIYDTRGIVCTRPERGQVARQSASEDRRLAFEGPRYRVEPFAERAGAIFIMPPKPGTGNGKAGPAIETALEEAVRTIGRLLRRRRPKPTREPITSTARPAARDFYVDGALTDSRLNERYRLPRNHCLGTFPDKTFQRTREGARRLRSIRATRGIR